VPPRVQADNMLVADLGQDPWARFFSGHRRIRPQQHRPRRPRISNALKLAPDTPLGLPSEAPREGECSVCHDEVTFERVVTTRAFPGQPSPAGLPPSQRPLPHGVGRLAEFSCRDLR